MMAEANGIGKRKRLGWWVGLTAGLVPVTLGGVLLAYWIQDHVPEWVYWRIGLAFLVALGAVYEVVAAAGLVGVPVLGVAVWRARRRGVRRPRAARGLLLGLSTLLSLAMVEAVAAAWQARAHRATAVPVGGLVGEKTGQAPARLVVPEEVALPETFPDNPRDGGLSLVVVGESSAQGVPYNFWVSIGWIVARQLEGVLPGHRVHLDIRAESGETLERQHQKLAGLTRRPDALIVYCGHNEFSARLPAGRELDYYLDDRHPSGWEAIAGRIARASPLVGLIRETADKCRVAIPPTPGAHRALVDSPAFTADESAALLADFRRRLEAIVAYAERVGAIPVLIVPPANDSGFEPNRSVLPASTPRVERRAFARDVLAARRLEATDPAESRRRYRALLDRQPGFAEAHYRLARLLEREGDWDAVYRHDTAARDLDGMPVRCPVAFQEAYREVARRHRCILVDAQAYFHAIGRHGLLDDALFHDAMHPSLRGQIALAQAVLQGLKAWGAFGWPADTPAPAIDPARCAETSGLGPYQWQRLCLWGMMAYDLFTPMHYDPAERRAKYEAFRRAHSKLVDGRAPESVGLPNIGVPPAVPIVPGAAVLTAPAGETRFLPRKRVSVPGDRTWDPTRHPDAEAGF